MATRLQKAWLVGLPALALLVGSARADEAAAESEPALSITPIVTYIGVDGDEKKFREDWWINEGWSGGIEDATFDHKLGKDWQLHLEGRALFEQEDYLLRLEIVNPGIGFVKAGYTQYRKWFDDTGGFYEFFSTPSFSLGRDLHLDISDLFVEVGLTLPNLPKLTLGYERLVKDGSKSMLEWGSVTELSLPPNERTRKIYPSYKDIDDTVDIFKAEIETDFKNVHLGDQFRYVHYNTATTKFDGGQLTLPALVPSKTVTVNERYSDYEFFNTFLMDTHVNEKVYLSLGYLYTTLNGNAGLNLDTVPFNATRDKDWSTQAVNVNLDSNVVNLNAMFGPYKGLIFYTGLQAEFTDNDGNTDAILTEIGAGGVTNNPVALIQSSQNKQSLEETFGLRYTRIPFTTLYAEGAWTEQDINLDETETINSVPDFQRVTDTSVFRQDYIAGFNTAPLRRVTLAGRYRHSIYNNDYDNTVDTTPGYPAFITAQDFTTDEVMARVTVRPTSRVSLAFKYQYEATDIQTSTDAVPAAGIPAGGVQSGNTFANIYSVTATVTPVSRLYVTALFSYTDARTVTFDNGSDTVFPYHGNVYTGSASIGVALDNKTDLNAQYAYSRANDFKNYSSTGLPLGADNERQVVLVSLSRQISKNMIAQLRYGFYYYNELNNGGVDDYQAQLASAGWTCRF